MNDALSTWKSRLVALLVQMCDEYDRELAAHVTHLSALWIAVQARVMRHNFDRARSPDLWFSEN